MAAWLVCAPILYGTVTAQFYSPQGAQVEFGRFYIQTSGTDCQLAGSATGLSNLFGDGAVTSADPTDPITIFLHLQQAVDHETDSNEVARAVSTEGAALSQEANDNGFGVTTYGDVAAPEGGSSGGDAPPTTGIGPNESMLLLADFPNFGHAYLLQGRFTFPEFRVLSSPPPWIEDPEPIVSADGTTWYAVPVFRLRVYNPGFGNIIDVFVSPDGSTIIDQTFPGAAGSAFGTLAGGIRLTRDLP